MDLEEGIWRIPATNMKNRNLHLVPLSRQALKILRDLHRLTGAGEYVFPSQRMPHLAMHLRAHVQRTVKRCNSPSDRYGLRSMADPFAHVCRLEGCVLVQLDMLSSVVWNWCLIHPLSWLSSHSS